jgi:DNA-binding protein H-NS
MNDIDDLIEASSIEQLKEFIERAQGAIEQKKAGEIEAIRKQMVEMSKRVDMAPEEVLNYSTRKRRPGKPKYRNPSDPEKTWTGRGKPPRWLKELADPESCRIPE